MISVRSKRWKFDRKFLTQRRSFWFDFCSNMMFSWWFRFDFLNFKHECFVRSDKANLNQRLKKKDLFVNQDYRVNSSVLKIKRRKRTNLLCFVSVYIHNEFIVVCFDVLFEWSNDTNLLCFIITKLYWNEMFCLFNVRVF